MNASRYFARLLAAEFAKQRLSPVAFGSRVNHRNGEAALVTPTFAHALCVYLMFNLSGAVFFLLPSYLVSELGAGSREIGAVSAIAPIASLLAVPFLGTALDVLGRRRLIQLGALLCAASSLAFGWLSEVGIAMYGIRFVQGVGFAMAFNGCVTYAADLAPQSRIAEAIGLFGIAGLVANALGPPLSEFLAESYGWKVVFGCAAAAALLSGILAISVVETNLRPLAAPTRAAAEFWTASLLAIFAAAAAMGTAFGTMTTFFQPWALQIGLSKLSDFFIAFTLAAIFARVVFGRAPDRLGRRLVGSVALLGYAAATFAMSRLAAGRLIPIGISLGLAHGLAYPSLNALALERTRASDRGRVMTYFNGAFNAGFSASVGCFGLMADHVGYRWVFVVGSTIALTSVIPLAMLKPRHASSP